jgi:hypothetical protein
VLIQKVGRLDRREIAAGFASVREASARAHTYRIGIAIASLALVLALSFWALRGALQSLSQISAGFSRFATGNFSEPIVVSALLQLRPPTETLNNYMNGIGSLALASIPVAMGVAILTRRLYDIDVIVNKTVVYLSLAAFITAVYIALVVGIGQAVGQQGKAGFELSVLATAVVAVAFQPVRERVSGWRTAWCTGSGPLPTRPCPRWPARSVPPCRPTSCCRIWPGCWRRRRVPHGRRSGWPMAAGSGWRPPAPPTTQMMPNEGAWRSRCHRRGCRNSPASPRRSR